MTPKYMLEYHDEFIGPFDTSSLAEEWGEDAQNGPYLVRALFAPEAS